MERPWTRSRFFATLILARFHPARHLNFDASHIALQYNTSPKPLPSID
jgi:hypothetical protein